MSLITASRALSNPTLVSGKTIERVRSAVAAIGRLAAQMIIDRCAGKTIAQPIVDAGFHIVERQSTAAA